VGEAQGCACPTKVRVWTRDLALKKAASGRVFGTGLALSDK